MKTLVLDAGALLGIERGDRTVLARIRVAQQRGFGLVTHALVVAQVWRDERGRQAVLARLLGAVDVRAIDPELGRRAGVLLGQAGLADPVDAALVLLARPGDDILTSDVGDISRLARAAGRRVRAVPC